VIEDTGQARYFAIAGGTMALLVTVFEINRNVLLRYIIRSHVSESRVQLPLYDVCVIALRGHGLRRQAIRNEIVHHSRKCSGALRKYLPQLPVQFFFRRFDATKPNPFVLLDVVERRAFRIDVSR
jgi:hypothetical protein